MIQSSCTLREAETKKGRCSVSDNGPLTFPRQLDVIADDLFMLELSMQGRVLRKCEENGNLRAQPDFWQQNRRLRKRKTGSGRPALIFPHFRIVP